MTEKTLGEMVDEAQYDVIEFTDEQGVQHEMLVLDTCEVDGTTYSTLVDASTIESIGPNNPVELHIVKHELQDGEQYLVSLEEAEFQTVIDRIEDHLRAQPFNEAQAPENE